MVFAYRTAKTAIYSSAPLPAELDQGERSCGKDQRAGSIAAHSQV
jgi:hypothetical protein